MEENKIHNANTYLCLLLDCFVNDLVLLNLLLQRGELEVLHANILLLEIDVTQPAIEEDGTRVELVLQTQLIVIDPSVAP